MNVLNNFVHHPPITVEKKINKGNAQQELVFDDQNGQKIIKLVIPKPQEDVLQFVYDILHFTTSSLINLLHGKIAEFPLVELQQKVNKLKNDVQNLMSSLSGNQNWQITKNFIPALTKMQEIIVDLLTKQSNPTDPQHTMVSFLNNIGNFLSMHQMLFDQFNLNFEPLIKANLYKATIPRMFEQNGKKCYKASCTYLHTLN